MLFVYLCVGVGLGYGLEDRCKFCMPATPLWFPSRNIFPFFSNLIFVAENVSVQP